MATQNAETRKNKQRRHEPSEHAQPERDDSEESPPEKAPEQAVAAKPGSKSFDEWLESEDWDD